MGVMVTWIKFLRSKTSLLKEPLVTNAFNYGQLFHLFALQVHLHVGAKVILRFVKALFDKNIY